MTNRTELLTRISRVHAMIKMAATRERRFELLDNVALLSGILKDVTAFETSLLADLDVD